MSVLSHDMQHLALASSRRFLILKLAATDRPLRDPDPAREFTVVGQGSGCEEGESITCICPLAVYRRSGNKSRPGIVQFFLAVGYSSGFLRIFSERGESLLSQPLHKRPLVRISVRYLARPALDDQEELLALFEDRRAAVIDGLSLWSALRMGSEDQEVPVVGFRKIALAGQEAVLDAVSCGPSPNTFAPGLPTAPAPPFTARYLAVGTRPMLAYYCTSDRAGFSLTNVANRVTSALGSLASSWFRKEERKPEDPAAELAAQPAASVPCALFLADPARRLAAAVPAPTGGLAALTDNLGRVMLLDVDEGEIVRMWKGSRGAQVGWLEVPMDAAGKGGRASPAPSPGGKTRTALVLAIYLPRGVLEIWRMRHGGRVAQLAVPPGMRLVPSAHGTLGGAVNGYKRTENPAGCVLLGASGEVRVVRVPPSFLA
ncbi:Rab3 GTPase-activating protein regulatory subunit N-terminus-domain-containing protein [Hyaloraphidium curvatum]|nr:Rab3 GTPase-activating protein regulatory subunit N-terminus-domain-containing protein [Hyaloraphidium curvatum]